MNCFENYKKNKKESLIYKNMITYFLEKDIDAECTICLEILKAEQSINLLFCGHYFHTSCIEEWLNKKRICPLCDTELPKKGNI